MKDQKGWFNKESEILGKLADVAKKMVSGVTYFDGTYLFTPNSDVPDDASFRLVLLHRSSPTKKKDGTTRNA